jgi:hypothetical protein
VVLIRSSIALGNVFDEMSTSELEDRREPSRVLDVTIRHASYSITNMVLHQVFDLFGAVDINVCELFEYVEARVIFQLKLQAADAFGSLHGRNIYDGCYHLEIKWGICHKSDAIPNMGRSKTMTSLSSHLPQAYVVTTTAMESTLNTTIVAAMPKDIDIEPNNLSSGTL